MVFQSSAPVRLGDILDVTLDPARTCLCDAAGGALR